MQTAVESDRRVLSTDTLPALLILVVCMLADELWKRNAFIELVEHFVQVVIESILSPHCCSLARLCEIDVFVDHFRHRLEDMLLYSGEVS